MCPAYITTLQPWKPHIFALAVIIFSLYIHLDWSAIKTLASSLLLSPSSPSSLRSLFRLQWNFDARPLPCYRELNMPCLDLLSAATFIPLASCAALKRSEKRSFLWKTHQPDLIFWDLSDGCFSALFWVSVDNIFISFVWGSGLVLEVRQIITDQ